MDFCSIISAVLGPTVMQLTQDKVPAVMAEEQAYNKYRNKINSASDQRYEALFSPKQDMGKKQA